MAAVCLFHGSLRLRSSPFSSLTPSLSNPSSTISSKIANPDDSFHKPPIHPKSIKMKFRHVIPRNFSPCKSNLSNGNLSTSSNLEEENKSGGNNQHGDNKRSEVEVSWVDLYLPKSARPYALLARLDKPNGNWLFAWPCFWSITLAACPGSLPDIKMLLLFGCESILLRGAACTWNDILDRDIDKKVARTMSRPLASGLLTLSQGLIFFLFQLLLGLGIFLQLNHYCRVLRAWSMLHICYPLMKRLTYWPQAFLGLTVSTGVLVGWAAVKGSLDPSIILPLYISTMFWTLLYDTIYAHQDKEDDLKVGVKSTAVMFGDVTKKWLTGFGVACISCLTLSGFNANLGWPFYAFSMAASGHLIWQIWTVDLSSGADCHMKFVSNKWFGAIVFFGILFGKLAT